MKARDIRWRHLRAQAAAFIMAALAPSSTAGAQVPLLSVDWAAGIARNTTETRAARYNTADQLFVHYAANVRIAKRRAVSPVMVVDYVPSFEYENANAGARCLISGADTTCQSFGPFPVVSGTALGLGLRRASHGRIEYAGSVLVGFYQARALIVGASASYRVVPHLSAVFDYRAIRFRDLGQAVFLSPWSVGAKVY